MVASSMPRSIVDRQISRVQELIPQFEIVNHFDLGSESQCVSGTVGLEAGPIRFALEVLPDVFDIKNVH